MHRNAQVPLSVAIITKNEEARLPDCLASVGFADEIVVVDSGSTDRTVEIATGFGCRTYIEEWKGDGRQKQSAVAKCRHEWVLVLDADERLTEEARGDLLRILASGESADAYSLPRRCFFHGRWIRRGGWWPDRVVRLFRKSKGSYRGITHGQWVTTGTVGQLDSCLDHLSFTDYRDMLNRLNTYSSFRADELYSDGAGSSLPAALLHGVAMFFKSYFLQLGILEGLDGLVIAGTKAGGSFFKYAKLIERHRGLPTPPPLTPSIGIIVSTYNSPRRLFQVLSGYLGQSRYPDELIVADDGSTAETKAAVDDFAAAAPFRVRHVWQEDQGFRAAKVRNEAAKVASSDYLVFTDGDCVPHPRFVEDHAALASPGWLVQGKRMLLGREISPAFRYRGWWDLLSLCLEGKVAGAHHLLRLRGVVLAKRGLRGVKTCNLGVFRRDYLAVNGSNEDFVGWGREDAELVSRLYNYGVRRRDPLFSALVFHLWHEENPRDNLKRNEEMLAVTQKRGGFYCANGIVKGVLSE